MKKRQSRPTPRKLLQLPNKNFQAAMVKAIRKILKTNGNRKPQQRHRKSQQRKTSHKEKTEWQILSETKVEIKNLWIGSIAEWRGLGANH